MFRLNLSRRLSLVTVVALIPTLAALGYNLVSLRRAQEAQAHESALRIAELVSLELTEVLRGTESLLLAIGSAPIVERGDAAACGAHVTRVVERLAQFEAIAIIDRDGRLRCSSFPDPEGMFLGDRGYFREALDAGRLVVGVYNEARAGGRAALPLAAPLDAGGPWSGGVAVAWLDLGWLGARIRDRGFAPQGALTIADREGRILAREPFPEDFVGTVIPDAFQHLVRAAAPGTLELMSQDGTRRVIGYYPAAVRPRGLYVSAGVSTEEAYAALDAATLRGVLIVLASLALALWLARSTSTAFIRRPVATLLDTIAAWRRGDLAARTGMSAREGEIGQVGAAVDEFMDELVRAREARATAEAQRELLLGELDHRVKNIAATVQAVARQTLGRPGAEWRGDVEAFLARLQAMSAAHGLLIRDAWQRAPVRDLVEAAVAPFDDSKRPRFILEGPDVALNSRAAQAFGMALHELGTNAVKYGALSAEGGSVALRWSVEDGGADGGTFRLVWEERGGPATLPPARRGFGSRMIEEALARQTGGEARMDWRREGLVCTVTAPLSGIGAREGRAA